jgi:hypothetical protein
MKLEFRPYKKADCARVLEICIAAFEPIHRGSRKLWVAEYSSFSIRTGKNNTRLRCARFRRGTQTGECTWWSSMASSPASSSPSWTAKRKTGEIGLNAVDGRGIGRAMHEFALKDLKERGAQIACVGTSGGAAHAPARRAFQAIGFDKALPGLHLFKVL